MKTMEKEQGDHKGDELFANAEASLTGCMVCIRGVKRFEEAAELFTQAAVKYKIVESWASAVCWN